MDGDIQMANQEYPNKKWADWVGYDVSSLPCTYLGLPLGNNPKSITLWDPVVDKERKRLASWKKGSFSIEVRLSLIKSIFNGTPDYYFSLFRAPSEVCKNREVNVWFPMGRDSWKESQALSYDKMGDYWKIKSIHLGGFGIGNFRLHNKTRLGKWLWHFNFELDTLWRKIIASKFDPHPFEWMPKGIRGTYWNLSKDITKDLPSFAHLVHCVVGEGRDTYFWEDFWVGDRPLCAFISSFLPSFLP